jgi:hypothetical protein
MGQSITNFEPNTTVTRAQFWTILSRLLYGDTNNSIHKIDWYGKHLQALQKSGIMNDISKPDLNEIRWYVIIMLMRSIQQ